VTSEKSFRINFGWFECFYAYYFNSNSYSCHVIEDCETITTVDRVTLKKTQPGVDWSLYSNFNLVQSPQHHYFSSMVLKSDYCGSKLGDFVSRYRPFSISYDTYRPFLKTDEDRVRYYGEDIYG